ncbi:hypothetical protein [Microcoleus sp. herbarium12]
MDFARNVVPPAIFSPRETSKPVTLKPSNSFEPKVSGRKNSADRVRSHL